jgi:putative nucleotidyltransferase with HDIG domain
VLIVAGRALVACTLPEAICRQFAGRFAGGGDREALPAEVDVAGESWALATMFAIGDTSALAVDSLTEPRRAADREAWAVVATFSIVLVGLGGAASLWLARTLSRPLDDLSRTLGQMATSRQFTVRLARPGTSRELDALTDTFNDLMRSLTVAEGETRSAYVGAIRALAVALDARDPYTAGHSERVSSLAVAIGRQMAIPAPDMDVLRLGALLHDIGKIGIADSVLGKPGPLTAEEFESIKTHTRVGARILRPVPFLAAHLPIVELHHERPDGKGYPHGLLGDEIPLLARIVRVADAFDAMTSARAYRPARAAGEALGELWRHAGTQFDTTVVEAFASAWPAIVAQSTATPSAAAWRGPSVRPFPARPGLTSR